MYGRELSDALAGTIIAVSIAGVICGAVITAIALVLVPWLYSHLHLSWS